MHAVATSLIKIRLTESQLVLIHAYNSIHIYAHDEEFCFCAAGCLTLMVLEVFVSHHTVTEPYTAASVRITKPLQHFSALKHKTPAKTQIANTPSHRLI